MPPTDTLAQLREQANDLYWNSDRTVEQIAADLGMSRRAVYTATNPLPAGTACTQCEEPLVFANRTARAANLASCPACGLEVSVSEKSGAAEGSGALPGAEDRPSPPPPTPAEMLAQAVGTNSGVVEVPGPHSRWEQIKEDLSAVQPERAAKIGGAAALGVALGAAAVKAIKKRS